MKPVFVPKSVIGDPTPWRTFGSTEALYRRWRPHICGICCVKSVGDATGATGGLSLWEITREAISLDVFRVNERRIVGAFHDPLANLVRRYGAQASVLRNVSTEEVADHVRNGSVVFLSVDLVTLDPAAAGGHLVVVYGDEAGGLRVHDSASVIASPGDDIPLAVQELDRLSNRKGILTTWPS